jgi:hypothetical protein
MGDIDHELAIVLGLSTTEEVAELAWGGGATCDCEESCDTKTEPGGDGGL